MDDLDQFQHLWDGTEPGWEVHRIHNTRWIATYKFAATGPTLKEVISLRSLLDEFTDLPMSEVWEQLRGKEQYEAKGTMGNIEAHALPPKAKQFGLRVELTSRAGGGEIPVSPQGALLIENGDLAAKVIAKMLEAGVPVREFFPD